jgi:6-phosphofructokinase 1
VFVIETMGRNAGWIALEAGTAGGADVSLLPEIDHDVGQVAALCRRRAEGGQRFTIVVVSEGAKPAGGRPELRAYIRDSAEPRRLGGIAARLAEELAGVLSCEVRSIELGHLQRGGAPTAGDRVLATLLGTHAVRLLRERAFGRMAAVRGGELTDVPLREVAGRSGRVPLDSPLIAAALAVGTSLGVSDGDLPPEPRVGTVS